MTLLHVIFFVELPVLSTSKSNMECGLSSQDGGTCCFVRLLVFVVVLVLVATGTCVVIIVLFLSNIATAACHIFCIGIWKMSSLASLPGAFSFVQPNIPRTVFPDCSLSADVSSVWGGGGSEVQWLVVNILRSTFVDRDKEEKGRLLSDDGTLLRETWSSSQDSWFLLLFDSTTALHVSVLSTFEPTRPR